MQSTAVIKRPVAAFVEGPNGGLYFLGQDLLFLGGSSSRNGGDMEVIICIIAFLRNYFGV